MASDECLRHEHGGQGRAFGVPGRALARGPDPRPFRHLKLDAVNPFPSMTETVLAALESAPRAGVPA